MRHYTSAQISLQAALIKKLQRTSLAQLKVKDLCQEANVARSTFYAYYDNPAALLEETEDWFIARLSALDQPIAQQQNKQPENFAYFGRLLIFVRKQQALLQALLVKNYDHRLVVKWKQAIKLNLLQRLKASNLSLEQGLILEIAASEVISAFAFYLQHPAMDLASIEKIIARRLSELNEYF